MWILGCFRGQTQLQTSSTDAALTFPSSVDVDVACTLSGNAQGSRSAQQPRARASLRIEKGMEMGAALAEHVVLQSTNSASAHQGPRTSLDWSQHSSSTVPTRAPSTFDLLSTAGLCSGSIKPQDLQVLTPARRTIQVCSSPAELLRDISGLSFVNRGASALVFKGIWQCAAVAVKLMGQSDSETLTPKSISMREALLGCELSHPNLVQCFSVRCLELSEEMLVAAERPTVRSRTEGEGGEEKNGGSWEVDDEFGPPPVPPAPLVPILANRRPSSSMNGLIQVPASHSHRLSKVRSSISNRGPISTPNLGATVTLLQYQLGAAGNQRGPPSPSTRYHRGGAPMTTLVSSDLSMTEQDGASAMPSLDDGIIGLFSASLERPGQSPPKQLSSLRPLSNSASNNGTSRASNNGTSRASNNGTPSRALRGPSSGALRAPPMDASLITPPESSWKAGGRNYWLEVLQVLRVKPGQVVTCVVCEWCDMDTLAATVHEERLFVPNAADNAGRKLHIRALLRTAREVALGLNHMHEAGVIHGDVKPGNVVLQSSTLDARRFVAKLTDLGLSRVPSEDLFYAYGEQQEGCIQDADWGTTIYMAPEHFKGRLLKASDIYSMGVLIWEMAHGRKPYGSMKSAEVIEHVKNGTIQLAWEEHLLPPQLVSLGKACLAHCPPARPTCRELIAGLVSIEEVLWEQIKSKQRRRSRTSRCA